MEEEEEENALAEINGSGFNSDPTSILAKTKTSVEGLKRGTEVGPSFLQRNVWAEISLVLWSTGSFDCSFFDFSSHPFLSSETSLRDDFLSLFECLPVEMLGYFNQ